MLSIFKRVVASVTATASYPIFTRIAQVLRLNLSKVEDYYGYANYVVPSDHFLVTFINSIAVSHTTSLETFIDLTYRAGVSAGRGLGLGSAMTPMCVLSKSYFFGTKYQEVVFLSDTEFPTQNPDVWLSMNPIKFWAHNQTDISYPRLVGYESKVTGFSVVEINVPLLMCQFRHFNNEQLELPEEQRRDVRHFVSQILVRSLESCQNTAFFNRTYATLKRAPVDESLPFTGLTLQNPLTQLDTLIEQINTNITQRTLAWENVLTLIPMPHGGSAYDYFRLPDQVQNRYVRCFEFAATFKVLNFLLDVDALSPGDKNTQYRTALRVLVDRMIAETIWQSFEGNVGVVQGLVTALDLRLKK